MSELQVLYYIAALIPGIIIVIISFIEVFEEGKSIWLATEDYCRGLNETTGSYLLVAFQPCELAYFRNEQSIGIDFIGLNVVDGCESYNRSEVVGDRFPFWDPSPWIAKEEELPLDGNFFMWPDFCVGFMPRCYSLGNEEIYDKLQMLHRKGLIPPIPQVATHIRVDCTDDFTRNSQLLARSIRKAATIGENFVSILGLMVLSFLISCFSCMCWSCFCCCWCIRRRQLKQSKISPFDANRHAPPIGEKEAVNPDDVNAEQFNNERWGEALRNRPHAD